VKVSQTPLFVVIGREDVYACLRRTKEMENETPKHCRTASIEIRHGVEKGKVETSRAAFEGGIRNRVEEGTVLWPEPDQQHHARREPKAGLGQSLILSS